VTFLTAGDPTVEISTQILEQLPTAGADLIELGMPFSDPMADGPAIQASSQRALDAGVNLETIFSMVKAFRKGDIETPLVLMGYFNPIYIYGVEKFISDAETAGVDGLIIVDLPPEENELLHVMENSNINFIYLVTPTTNNKRLPKVVKHASGFIYYVSVAGITGTKSASARNVKSALLRIRQYTNLPIAVGFGIKTPAQVVGIAKLADAAVVGSALVSCVAKNLDDNGRATSACKTAVLDLVAQLSGAVRSISKTP
jgi:tryptophan synthase alpha chain